MTQKTPLLVILLATCLLVVSCGSVQNYPDAFEPEFIGSYATPAADFSGSIKVVSYNISFGEDVALAISELSELDELKNADIILLQEMDEVGTQSIAQTLGYNFVYFPASIHNRNNRNFGNAILSKWPIDAPQKIILPFKSPRNQQIRIAVQAVVTINEEQILTYSVHTETFWLGPRKREEQIDGLVESIATESQYILVGGDFNTLTRQSVEELEETFRGIGLERVSRATGYTARYGPLEFTLDHIFSRGLSVIEAGKSKKATASDHLPIWVIVAPD